MVGRRRRAPDVAARADALELALKSGAERLDPNAVAQARAVLDRGGERLRLGGAHTVVALAGATGSGKSSLFNALAGVDLSDVGARRPTTGKPLACVWGPEEADELLDWLDVPRRHRVNRESVLDADREKALHGLVLLDLPDHDSTVMAHRLEVDRLVDLVDLLVWVVDPQKYADEALHTGYLRRLRGHDSVMLVVLNQIDRLPTEEAVETCRRDLRRLLDADGLDQVRLVTASALRGDGVDALRSMLADVVRTQGAFVERTAADMQAAAVLLAKGVARTEADASRFPAGADLVDALAGAAGIPVVLEAVRGDYVRQASARVGWPLARWWRRMGPDPLRRLRLARSAETQLRELTRSSLPEPTPAQRARVELAVRNVTTAAADGLPPRWADAVRAAGTSPGEDLSDALDQAVLSVDLTLRRPIWWSVFGTAQFLLTAAALVGFGWLATLGIMSWLRLPEVGTPYVGPFPLPTLLFLGGLLGGLLLAVLGRGLVRRGARRRRAAVEEELRAAVARVAWVRVVAPVAEVLDDHKATREALSEAL